MANSVFQVKRTSVSGRAANSTTLPNPGELAINMADRIMYSTNGTFVFEIGANNTNVNITGNATINAIIANGTLGTSGQVLSSNGTTIFWATPAAGGGGSASIISSNSAPSTPANNDLWWDNSQGSMFVRYGDGDSAQWVESLGSGVIYTTAVNAASVNSSPMYIQTTQPSSSPGDKYMWVQTGLGDDLADFTIWIEDGS